MAKGLRSTSRQRNKSKLRAAVYGPVVDSRTERLSAKLQELVSNPKKAKDSDPASMQIDNADKIGNPDETKHKDYKEPDDMDLDGGSENTKLEGGKKETAQPNNRIQKKTRNKRRPSIGFGKHAQKARRTSKKK